MLNYNPLNIFCYIFLKIVPPPPPPLPSYFVFQVRTIFIDGLPAAWDEDRVKEHLKRFGRIEKVELARNMPAAKRNDFGFITFDIHDAAVRCVEAINDSEIGDGDKKVLYDKSPEIRMLYSRVSTSTIC